MTMRTVTLLRRGHDNLSRVEERSGLTDAAVAAVLTEGRLPIETNDPASPAAAYVLSPAAFAAALARGLAAWRLTVHHDGRREDVLELLARCQPAYLRTDIARASEAVALCALPGNVTVAQIEASDAAAASAAILIGIGDILVDKWTDDEVAVLRDRHADEILLVERSAFPPGIDLDHLRAALARPMLKAFLDQVDGSGCSRPRDAWAPGKDAQPPVPAQRLSSEWEDAVWRAGAADPARRIAPDLAAILERALSGRPPTRDEVERLFRARGAEVETIAWAADQIRRRVCGDDVTYVVNRNINYTNLCYFRCGFCGFSKGPKSLNLRGDPYLLSIDEVVHRSEEAWERGATEVCLQGGIHPDFTGSFYVDIVAAIRDRLPDMHVHGFTALEVWQGASTLGVSVRELLTRLRDAGLGTLPGTAAEVLDDAVRLHLCPDKIRTSQWAEVHITAHELGLRSNNTLMFGHIDGPASWANHIENARQIQQRTGGFTEFVPLPFVHMGAPIYLQGRARPGPTWDEVVLVHAVGRIAFDGLIPNIQASWVKLGLEGGARLLAAGCNDLGGTLMDENISRAAGAAHGQLATPEDFQRVILAAGRAPRQRTTTYGEPPTPAAALATVG